MRDNIDLTTAISAAARALSGNEVPDEQQRAVAEAAVRAAAPLIAARACQRAADEIFAHADTVAPLVGGEAPSALRRHLHIGAHIAAGIPTPEQMDAYEARTQSRRTGRLTLADPDAI